ncbi:MAG: aldehyde dehydrogenase family protein, partial [Planctomycetia bacterium]
MSRKRSRKETYAQKVVGLATTALPLHDTGLPAATVQLLHGVSPEDGERLVADSRVGATGFTGGQEAGKRL